MRIALFTVHTVSSSYSHPQVVYSASTEAEADAYLVEEEVSAIADFLASQLDKLNGPAKSAVQARSLFFI